MSERFILLLLLPLLLLLLSLLLSLPLSLPLSAVSLNQGGRHGPLRVTRLYEQAFSHRLQDLEALWIGFKEFVDKTPWEKLKPPSPTPSATSAGADEVTEGKLVVGVDGVGGRFVFGPGGRRWGVFRRFPSGARCETCFCVWWRGKGSSYVVELCVGVFVQICFFGFVEGERKAGTAGGLGVDARKARCTSTKYRSAPTLCETPRWWRR